MQAERDLAPLRSFGGPALVVIEAMPYPAMNALFDAGYPRGALNYWRSNFIDSLPDEAIDIMVDHYGTVPSSMTPITLEHFHGEATRIPVEATACANRTVGWNLLTPSVWTDPAATDANIAWTRDLSARLAPFVASRRWLNYTDIVEDDVIDRARAVFGPNLPRLVQIKKAWDPGNLFHVNLNIRPD